MPARGVIAELVEEVKGLALELLARGRIPGDLNRILDLYAEVCQPNIFRNMAVWLSWWGSRQKKWCIKNKCQALCAQNSPVYPYGIRRPKICLYKSMRLIMACLVAAV